MPFRLVLRLVVARIESQCGERVLRGPRGCATHGASLSSRVASGDLPTGTGGDYTGAPHRIRAGEVEGEYESSGIDGRSGREE